MLAARALRRRRRPAFDDAVADGVDVISFSIGSEAPSPYFEDAAAIGSFHAMRRGVLTSAGAGNAGVLDGGNVCNVAPWMLSVAASSIDRRFTDTIVLGNGETFVVRAGTKLLSVLLIIFLQRNKYQIKRRKTLFFTFFSCREPPSTPSQR